MSPPAHRSHTAAAAATLALPLVLLACGQPDALTMAFEARDSAGVEIVWNGGIGPWGKEPVDSLVEEMRIGAVDGDERYVLAGPMKVLEGADGSLYVGNEGTLTVRRYNADGTWVRDYGGQGQGPGELPRRMNDLWLDGGLVMVLDQQGGGRVNVFREEGELAHFVEGLDAGAGGYLLPLGGVPGAWLGGWLDWPARQAALKRGDTVGSYPLVLATELVPRVIRDTVAHLGIGPTIPDGSGGQYEPLYSPFAITRTPLELLAVVPDGPVLVHRGLPYEFRIIGRDGTLQRIVRSEFSPRRLGRGAGRDYVRAMEAWLDSAPPHAQDTPAPHQIADAEQQAGHLYADTLPPLSGILAGRDGSVWLHRRDLAGDPARLELEARWDVHAPRPSHWDVFSGEGRLMGQVRLPVGFTPHVVGGTTVTGILLDGMGVEYIVRYRIVPPVA